MITAGAKKETRARVTTEIEAGTNGKEMERSSREKGRPTEGTKFRPPPVAASALLGRLVLRASG
jgi:hypothetical protein